ncbi:MAG: hypothetical protein HZB30_11230 [Nitrospirae bacterium]|nr:hypothetical protein [Nitrospirota bacterium]
MRKKIFAVFLILSGCIFVSHDVFAAWTQAKGHSYNSLGLSYYKTTEKFTTLHRDSDDKLTTTSGEIYKDQVEEFTSTKLGYYGEYGITDTLTAIASFWYDWQRSNDTMRYAKEDGPSGIGDITLGLRYNLSPNLLGSGVLMSVQGEVKIPEAYKYEHPLFNLNQGDGQYDTTLLLQFGRGIGKGYAVFNIGYKYRFENDKFDSFKPSDQFKMSLSGGYAVTSWMSVIGGLDWINSVGNADISDEMYNRATRGGAGSKEGSITRNELIRDTLALEQNDLSGTIGLQFNITPQVQTVLSYSRDLTGAGYFSTRNNAFGETVALNLVYIH